MFLGVAEDDEVSDDEGYFEGFRAALDQTQAEMKETQDKLEEALAKIEYLQ